MVKNKIEFLKKTYSNTTKSYKKSWQCIWNNTIKVTIISEYFTIIKINPTIHCIKIIKDNIKWLKKNSHIKQIPTL